MFAELFAMAGRGEQPSPDQWAGRLKAAIVKKLGVLRMPYQFWPRDPKINPPLKELYWAALLVGDQAAFVEVVGMIELESLQAYKKSKLSNGDLKKIQQEWLTELLQTVPPEERCEIEQRAASHLQ